MDNIKLTKEEISILEVGLFTYKSSLFMIPPEDQIEENKIDELENKLRLIKRWTK